VTDVFEIHLRDQIDVAKATAASIQRAIVPLMGPGVRERHLPLTSWPGQIIEDRMRGLNSGDERLAVCQHIYQPCVLIMPSWVPVVVCDRCIALIPAPTEADDHYCDDCQRFGPELVHETTARNGFFIVIGGVCTQCRNNNT
jgi:hypothetical protein